MKKYNVMDLLVLRACYNQDLNKAIMEENAEYIKEYLNNYDMQDRAFYDFSQEINTAEAKQKLTEAVAEMEAAYKSGRKYFGM